MLRDFRCAAGLSQETLAERARLSPGAISSLERSARRGPQAQTVVLLAEALALTPADQARLEEAAALGRRRGVRGPGGDRPASTRHNLPSALTTFCGRERELADCGRLIEERRVVTLLGAGGVGKTRLAIELARAKVPASAFAGGIWLVELAPLTSAELIASAIAQAVDDGTRRDGSTAETLAAGFSQKHAARTLLVLDNCEHLIDGCARVAETLVKLCPAITILATSREALRIEGERVVRVAPLAYADAAADSPALTLLIDRLVDADYRRYSELRAQDRVLAARICRRLDGLPLALELAAARARDLPLAHIVAGLDERFTLLGVGRRTADRRHHTLRGMIDWSYALLTSAERELFTLLSLFAGSFTPQAAVAVCAPENPTGGIAALQSLVAKSLVTMVEDRAGEARYRLLESLRAYALDRLRESGTYDAGMCRFATYFGELAHSCDARYGHMPNRAFFALVEPEIANFRAALEWSLAEGHDPALGAALAGAMGLVFRQASRFAEGIAWAERALALDVTLPASVVGRLHVALSIFHFTLGAIARGLESAIAATAAYRRTDDSASLAWARTMEAYCLYRLGRLDQAREAGGEAVAMARSSGDSMRLAGALNAYTVTLSPERAFERFAMLEEAIRCSQAAGDADAIVPKAQLGAAYFEAGNFRAALSFALEVVESARRSRDKPTVSSGLVNVAACALALDEVELADAAAREALESAEALGKSMIVMLAFGHLATVASRRGAPVRAARCLGASDALLAEFGVERERAEQMLYRETIEAICAAIGEPAYLAHLAAGRALSFDVAVAEALREDGSNA